MQRNQELSKDERLVKIEEAIVHLANLVENHVSQQQAVNTDLYSKFDSNNRTNWGVIWSAIGVVSVILFSLGTAIYKPINARQETMESHFTEKHKDAEIRINTLEARERKNFEMLIRHDERMIRVDDERYLGK